MIIATECYESTVSFDNELNFHKRNLECLWACELRIISPEEDGAVVSENNGICFGVTIRLNTQWIVNWEPLMNTKISKAPGEETSRITV